MLFRCNLLSNLFRLAIGAFHHKARSRKWFVYHALATDASQRFPIMEPGAFLLQDGVHRLEASAMDQNICRDHEDISIGMDVQALHKSFHQLRHIPLIYRTDKADDVGIGRQVARRTFTDGYDCRFPYLFGYNLGCPQAVSCSAEAIDDLFHSKSISWQKSE